MADNIIRLLQTLDKDCDPSNGIYISDLSKASSSQVGFLLNESDFANSVTVISLINNAGLDAAVSGLVGSVDAVAHLETSLASLGGGQRVGGVHCLCGQRIF